MHCLYCDRPLALLKRLTGDGEFCSKEHRKIYQKEHNQLALARLLEAQPSNKGKRPILEPRVAAAPQPVAKPEPRQPEQAGFISDFFREASVVSGANRSLMGPFFQNTSLVLDEPLSKQEPANRRLRPRPKAAAFLSEPLLRLSAGEARFPGRSAAQPLPGRVRLGEAPLAIKIRLQPGRAGFIFGKDMAGGSSGTGASAAVRPASGPRFKPMVPTEGESGISRSGSHPRLPAAQALVASAIGAQSIPGRVRNVEAGPRWRPLSAAVPTRPLGKIILVLGSFLRRPVRLATQESPPESFEIRFRPIPFPQYPPRMGTLEERLYRTDRIGIASP